MSKAVLYISAAIAGIVIGFSWLWVEKHFFGGPGAAPLSSIDEVPDRILRRLK